MSKYHKCRKKPKRFLALTSLTVEEFDELLADFEKSFFERMEKYTLEGKKRQNRRYVDYENSPLPSSGAKLFFILSYCKTYALQEVQGALFDISQPKANQWIQCLKPVLQATLAVRNELPARTLEALTLQFKGQSLFFHDGTERPILRPSDPDKQRLYYSGKAHAHTIKNNLLIEMSCRVLFLTATVEGKMHDKKLADQSAYTLPQGSRLSQDSGFQGFSQEGVAILQPKKKPRDKALSDLDKSVNQWHASLRIRIEHAIGGVQRLRIVKDKLRNWKEGFRDSIMEIACGLHNFRLKFRPWNYAPLQLHLFVDF
jgi:hypothetical protein